MKRCSCAADALCDDNNPRTVDTCEASSRVYTPTAGDGCCPTGPVAVDSASSISVGTVQRLQKRPTAKLLTLLGSCGEEGCNYEEKEGCCVTASDCDDGQEATTDLCIAGSCVFAVGETLRALPTESAPGSIPVRQDCAPRRVFHRADRSGGCCESARIVPCSDSCTGATCADFQCGEAPLEGFRHCRPLPSMETSRGGQRKAMEPELAVEFLSESEGGSALYFGQAGVPNYDVGIAAGSVQSPQVSASQVTAIRFDRIAHVEPITSRDKFWLEVVQSGEGVEVWNKNDNNGPGLGWKTEVVPLTEVLLDSEFRLRFAFDSVDATNNEYEGLYVDNVALGFLCE